MGSPDYLAQRTWSDKFVPQIKQIVGPRLLEVSSFEVDTRQATDLVVVRADSLMIACRIRKPSQWRYNDEFTIRSRNNGHKTEFKKIIEGWSDWMFYGHATPNDTIRAWLLLDLGAFRTHWLRQGWNRNYGIKYGEIENKDERGVPDGTCFYWFKYSTFPSDPPLVIDSSGLSNYR